MKTVEAGIFSSARSRLATSLVGVLAVGRLLQLSRRRRLELLALPLRRRDAVLDRLADRVLRVGDHLPRPLRGFLGLLDRLAPGELDRLAADRVDLAAPGAGCDVRPGD